MTLLYDGGLSREASENISLSEISRFTDAFENPNEMFMRSYDDESNRELIEKPPISEVALDVGFLSVPRAEFLSERVDTDENDIVMTPDLPPKVMRKKGSRSLSPSKTLKTGGTDSSASLNSDEKAPQHNSSNTPYVRPMEESDDYNNSDNDYGEHSTSQSYTFSSQEEHNDNRIQKKGRIKLGFGFRSSSDDEMKTEDEINDSDFIEEEDLQFISREEFRANAELGPQAEKATRRTSVSNRISDKVKMIKRENRSSPGANTGGNNTDDSAIPDGEGKNGPPSRPEIPSIFGITNIFRRREANPRREEDVSDETETNLFISPTTQDDAESTIDEGSNNYFSNIVHSRLGKRNSVPKNSIPADTSIGEGNNKHLMIKEISQSGGFLDLTNEPDDQLNVPFPERRRGLYMEDISDDESSHDVRQTIGHRMSRSSLNSNISSKYRSSVESDLMYSEDDESLVKKSSIISVSSYKSIVSAMTSNNKTSVNTDQDIRVIKKLPQSIDNEVDDVNQESENDLDAHFPEKVTAQHERYDMELGEEKDIDILVSFEDGSSVKSSKRKKNNRMIKKLSGSSLYSSLSSKNRSSVGSGQGHAEDDESYTKKPGMIHVSSYKSLLSTLTSNNKTNPKIEQVDLVTDPLLQTELHEEINEENREEMKESIEETKNEEANEELIEPIEENKIEKEENKTDETIEKMTEPIEEKNEQGTETEKHIEETIENIIEPIQEKSEQGIQEIISPLDDIKSDKEEEDIGDLVEEKITEEESQEILEHLKDNKIEEGNQEIVEHLKENKIEEGNQEIKEPIEEKEKEEQKDDIIELIGPNTAEKNNVDVKEEVDEDMLEAKEEIKEEVDEDIKVEAKEEIKEVLSIVEDATYESELAQPAPSEDSRTTEHVEETAALEDPNNEIETIRQKKLETIPSMSQSSLLSFSSKNSSSTEINQVQSDVDETNKKESSPVEEQNNENTSTGPSTLVLEEKNDDHKDMIGKPPHKIRRSSEGSAHSDHSSTILSDLPDFSDLKSESSSKRGLLRDGSIRKLNREMSKGRFTLKNPSNIRGMSNASLYSSINSIKMESTLSIKMDSVRSNPKDDLVTTENDDDVDFFGWGDDKSYSDEEEEQPDEKDSDDDSSDDLDVDFASNVSEARARAKREETIRKQMEEEYDSKRPWRKAPPNVSNNAEGKKDSNDEFNNDDVNEINGESILEEIGSIKVNDNISVVSETDSIEIAQEALKRFDEFGNSNKKLLNTMDSLLEAFNEGEDQDESDASTMGEEASLSSNSSDEDELAPLRPPPRPSPAGRPTVLASNTTSHNQGRTSFLGRLGFLRGQTSFRLPNNSDDKHEERSVDHSIDSSIIERSDRPSDTGTECSDKPTPSLDDPFKSSLMRDEDSITTTGNETQNEFLISKDSDRDQDWSDNNSIQLESNNVDEFQSLLPERPKGEPLERIISESLFESEDLVEKSTPFGTYDRLEDDEPTDFDETTKKGGPSKKSGPRKRKMDVGITKKKKIEEAKFQSWAGPCVWHYKIRLLICIFIGLGMIGGLSYALFYLKQENKKLIKGLRGSQNVHPKKPIEEINTTNIMNETFVGNWSDVSNTTLVFNNSIETLGRNRPSVEIESQHIRKRQHNTNN